MAYSKLMKVPQDAAFAARPRGVQPWGCSARRGNSNRPTRNYSDNPQHPFKVIVASLEAEGADLLFAAGNCGPQCPDGRCAFATPPDLRGQLAPGACSAVGAWTRREPGWATRASAPAASRQKPDVLSYTHFDGSRCSRRPGQRHSAACPCGGVIAAVRSGWSAGQVSPAQLRDLVRKTATDLGGTGVRQR